MTHLVYTVSLFFPFLPLFSRTHWRPPATRCDDPLCQQGHGWEVIQGAPKPIEVDPSAIEDFGVRMITTNDVHLNRTYEDGYSIIVEFGGYSSTHLCTRYTRTAPIDGHTKCPLKRDWYQMCECCSIHSNFLSFPFGRGALSRLLPPRFVRALRWFRAASRGCRSFP